jgi:hypothetical protein
MSDEPIEPGASAPLTAEESQFYDRVDAAVLACQTLCSKRRETPEALINVDDGLTYGELSDLLVWFQSLQERVERTVRGDYCCIGCGELFPTDEIREHVVTCAQHPLSRKPGKARRETGQAGGRMAQ